MSKSICSGFSGKMLRKSVVFAVVLCVSNVLGQSIDYQQVGEALLDKMISRFYNDAHGLYAEKIDSSEAIVQEYNGVSFVWPASHVLRALRWGNAVNSQKYYDAFRAYVYSVYKYKSAYLQHSGYAVLPGSSEMFFDDNAVMCVEMALADSVFHDPAVFNDAHMAYEFCDFFRDPNGCLPQRPPELGQGMFYSMAVSPVGYCANLLHRLSGQDSFLVDAVRYYEQLNDPARLLKDTTRNLFNQYTFCTDGAWSFTKEINGSLRDGRGLRAYQTTYVIRQALALFQATADSAYLIDAREMLEGCVGHFYEQGKGLRENAFWGGNDMVDALEEMYAVTGEDGWHQIAKDIVDFLITYGRDQHGWYPSDEDDSRGDWHLDRRDVTPSTVSIMGQAAAASAIFNLAYHIAHPTRQNGRLPSRDQKPRVSTAVTRNTLTVNAPGYRGEIDLLIVGVDGRVLVRTHGLAPLVIPLHGALATGIAVARIVTKEATVTRPLLIRQR